MRRRDLRSATDITSSLTTAAIRVSGTGSAGGWAAGACGAGAEPKGTRAG